MNEVFRYLVSIMVVVLIMACMQEYDLTESMKRGKEIYSDFCKSCHLAGGEGVPTIYPPLAGSDYLMNHREESLRVVKYGQMGKITVNGIEYNGIMAPLGLTDQEVADVMNYILNSWGNKSDEVVTPKKVSNIKKN